ncbi:MAG: peptide ABC transporter substrate-binding protein [Verrucomicrobiota bacterium]
MALWIRTLWLSLILGILLGCHPKESLSSFTYVNGPEPESLDPAIITGQSEMRLISALFEGLTARNAHGEVEPGMAESWVISPDGKTIRFTLRAATWSNGNPVTAQDFVYSWERALNPLMASKYAELLYPIARAEDYNKGKVDDFNLVGVHALDLQTLEVKLENPTPFFLDLCSMPTLYPVHFLSLKSEGRHWTKPGHLISNGAYTLKDWRIDDRVVLQKNLKYWRVDQVKLNQITALTTSSATTAFNLFYSGKADLIMDKGLIPSLMIDHLRQKEYFHSNPFLGAYFYRFNVTKKPFNNAKVRKAFALAVDKKRVVEKITRAGEPVANALTPPGVRNYTPPTGLVENHALAQKLLAEAGYPKGKGFPAVSILYNSSELNQQIAVEIQSMWSEVLGVHVTLQNQEWKVYLGSLDQLDFDIARSSWVGDYNDANTFLDCFVTGRGNNRTGWSNAEYDRLMAQSASESNSQKRSELMQSAERILVEQELPIIPIHHYVGMALYHSDKLGGFESNVVDDHPLRELYWKEQPKP